MRAHAHVRAHVYVCRLCRGVSGRGSRYELVCGRNLDVMASVTLPVSRDHTGTRGSRAIYLGYVRVRVARGSLEVRRERIRSRARSESETSDRVPVRLHGRLRPCALAVAAGFEL